MKFEIFHGRKISRNYKRFLKIVMGFGRLPFEVPLLTPQEV